MPESVSIAVTGYALALCLARPGSAVSREADTLRDAGSAILAAAERSIALFGAKEEVINRLYEIAGESREDGWDGDDGVAISDAVLNRAISFIRALPDGFALPDVAADPDGAISFDWIAARTRMFSVSIGTTNRIAFAWIDGTDRGHAVARFDGDAVPARILHGIREIRNGRVASVRVA